MAFVRRVIKRLTYLLTYIHKSNFLFALGGQLEDLKCRTIINVGQVSASDPAAELTALPRLSSWWGGGLLSLYKNPATAAGSSVQLQVTCPKGHLSDMELCRFRNLPLNLTLTLCLCLYVSDK